MEIWLYLHIEYFFQKLILLESKVSNLKNVLWLILIFGHDELKNDLLFYFHKNYWFL